MIDGVTVNNETQVINTGGKVSPPPPSSPEVQNRQADGQVAAQVDLSTRVAADSNKPSERADKVDSERVDQNLEKELQEAISSLNDKLNRLDREVVFKLDKKIDRHYISVVDKSSKEVIREFPPEEIRTFIARFDEFNSRLDTSEDVKSMIINLEV